MSDGLDGNIPVWGTMIPLDRSISGKIDLTKPDYTFGTGENCDYQIIVHPNQEHAYFEQYSEIHFRLEKEDTDSETLFYIHDLSDHGTYVNGKKIGKNYKRPLEPDSEISLVSVENKAFIFIVESPADLVDIPDEIKSSYIISKTLGRGAFGKVRLLFTQDGTAKVAMKCVEKSPYYGITDAEVLRETEIMVRLKHPCIIEIIETHNTPTCLYIIMELAEAGTLQNRLKRHGKLEEMTTRIIIHQILLAVEYLHKQGITHRDLKPDNILLTTRNLETLIKVTDFGVSKAVTAHTLMKTLAGTPCYIAPEIWKNQIIRGKYSNAVDVWSIGIIFYQCLIGDLPIKVFGQGQYRHDLMETYTIQQKFDSYIWAKMPQAEDLGRKLLKVEPTERILVQDALKHEWFQNEQSLRRIEELTGLALEGSGKAAMNVNPSDRRPSKEEAEEELLPHRKKIIIHPVPSPGFNPDPPGPQPPQRQFFPDNRYEPERQPPDRPYQPDDKKQPYPYRPQENHRPEQHYTPDVQYQPKQQYESEEFLPPNRIRYQPEQPYSPSQIPDRPYSPSRIPDGPYSPSRIPDRPYSPSRIPDRPYSPSRIPDRPYSPSRQYYQPGGRPYSPNLGRRHIQPRQCLDRRPYEPAQIEPRQQPAAEGLYVSRVEIGAMQFPEGNIAAESKAQQPDQFQQRRGALPQQAAGLSTLYDNQPPVVIPVSESNSDPTDSQPHHGQNANGEQEFRSNLAGHKKFKSQEELSIEHGPVLTPKPHIKPRQSNLRPGVLSRSPYRNQIAGGRRPLSNLNYRVRSALEEAEQTPPVSPIDESGPPTFEQTPNVPKQNDRPYQQQAQAIHQPQAVHQAPYQQQFQNTPQKVVNQMEKLGLEANYDKLKHDKLKQDVAQLQAQQYYEEQQQLRDANGYNVEPRQQERSPFQPNNQRRRGLDEPVSQEAPLYPRLDDNHRTPTRPGLDEPVSQGPEMYPRLHEHLANTPPHIPHDEQYQQRYHVSLEDMRAIQDIIPDSKQADVAKLLMLHNGDKNAVVDTLMHMNSP